jgi:hypothetical protein
VDDRGGGRTRPIILKVPQARPARQRRSELADVYRESTESWADLLRDAARRGMRAPVLAIGDGALGFWGALREVFPQARTQRCWFHYADLRIMPMWSWIPLRGRGFGLVRSA